MNIYLLLIMSLSFKNFNKKYTVNCLFDSDSQRSYLSRDVLGLFSNSKENV